MRIPNARRARVNTINVREKYQVCICGEKKGWQYLRLSDENWSSVRVKSVPLLGRVAQNHHKRRTRPTAVLTASVNTQYN